MPIHVFSDASYNPYTKEGRGAYVILRKEGKKIKQRIIKRTPMIRNTSVNDSEILTACQALIHAHREFPDDREWYFFCDATVVLDLFKNNVQKVFGRNGNKYFRRMMCVISDNGKTDIPHIMCHHTKAHKNILKTEPQKYNFLCDVLASINNN